MSIIKISVIILVIISAISSNDIFAAQKTKKKVARAGISADFVTDCTSMSEISEDKVLKCSIDLSTNIGKKRFSQIEPYYVERGEYEKKSEFDLRSTASFSKWKGKHVIFRADNSDNNQSIVYDRDNEVVRFNITVDKVGVGTETKRLGFYRASNAFGASFRVHKGYIRSNYIYDNEFSGFANNIEFSMSIDDARKNFKNLIVLYDVVLELRPNEENEENEESEFNYSKKDFYEDSPTADLPLHLVVRDYLYFVKVHKVMIVNGKSGVVLAQIRKKLSSNNEE